jgi:hypothetical protein
MAVLYPTGPVIAPSCPRTRERLEDLAGTEAAEMLSLCVPLRPATLRAICKPKGTQPRVYCG